MHSVHLEISREWCSYPAAGTHRRYCIDRAAQSAARSVPRAASLRVYFCAELLAAEADIVHLLLRTFVATHSSATRHLAFDGTSTRACWRSRQRGRQHSNTNLASLVSHACVQSRRLQIGAAALAQLSVCLGMAQWRFALRSSIRPRLCAHRVCRPSSNFRTLQVLIAWYRLCVVAARSAHTSHHVL